MVEIERRIAQAPACLPAGWDPDPSGRHQLRYWNGRGWTATVSDYDVISLDLVPFDPAGPRALTAATTNGAQVRTNGSARANGASPTAPAAVGNGQPASGVGPSEHADARRPVLTTVATSSTPEGTATPDELAHELADAVERLVLHLRERSRRDRRIGNDLELSTLAIDAMRKARELTRERP